MCFLSIKIKQNTLMYNTGWFFWFFFHFIPAAKQMEEMVYRPMYSIWVSVKVRQTEEKKKNFPILCPLGPEMTSRHHFLTKPNWITKKDPYFYFLTTQPAPPQKQPHALIYRDTYWKSVRFPSTTWMEITIKSLFGILMAQWHQRWPRKTFELERSCGLLL